MRIVRGLTSAVVACALALTACGGGSNDPGPAASGVVTDIFSDPAIDGDIEQTAQNTFTITQGMSPTVQSVLAGVDPVSLSEFRAFLTFPLGGAGGVPSDAIIDSAFLEVFIDDLEPMSGTLPILIDLVTFQPPTLISTDYDRTLQPPLASTTISPPIGSSDVGTYVSVDVTELMIQAQNAALPDFQVRVMEDVGPLIPVLMSIDDTTGADRSNRAPVLTVTYH